jgi:hypothetical protein
MIRLIWYTILAKVGSAKAHGIVEVLRTTRAVRTEWNRCGWEPTEAHVKRFLAEAYGVINLDPDGDPAQRFNKAELDQIFDAVAQNYVVNCGAGEAGFRLPCLSKAAR